MNQVFHSVYELIGNTPLLELKAFSTNNVTIYAKLEYMNPGGSVKDRLGTYLIESSLANGIITKETTLIEATAGNTGIGLALVAQKYGMKLIVCVPEKFSIEKQILMKSLGAQLVVTPSLDGMDGAIKKAEELVKTIPNSHFFNQFENFDNPKTYYYTLGPELYNQLHGEIDVFVAGAGSGGTFTGTSQYLKSQHKDIRTVIVEPVGSILNGGKIQDHEIEGIGMNKITPFMDENLFDQIYTVSDHDAFYYVRQLALKSGIFVGSSSGAALAAAVKEAEIRQSGNIIVIFPDSAERYLSKDIFKGDF